MQVSPYLEGSLVCPVAMPHPLLAGPVMSQQYSKSEEVTKVQFTEQPNLL